MRSSALNYGISRTILFVSQALCVLSQIVLHKNDGELINSNKLIVHGNTVFVSGTDFFLKIDFNKNSPSEEVSVINFKPESSDLEQCQIYSIGVPCNNIVKVLEVAGEDRLLTCGTNAGHPKCHYFNTTDNTFKPAEFGASSWLYVYPGGSISSLYLRNLPEPEFYVASVKDTSAHMSRKLPSTLKTDKKWMTDPEFINTYSFGTNMVYLFFNEKSSLFNQDDFVMNNGRTDYYGMVARVCRGDQGGSWKKSEFMTFNKVRLICPSPGGDLKGHENLYYNELVSTVHSGEFLYGIFRLNRRWNINSTAICRFKIKSIDDTIEGKHFENNEPQYVDESSKGYSTFSHDPNQDSFSHWTCPNSATYNVRSSFEVFATSKILVRMNVKPDGNRPLQIVQENFHFIFVQKLEKISWVFLLSENGALKKIELKSNITKELFHRKFDMKNEKIIAAQLLEDKNVIIATTQTGVLTLTVDDCTTYNDCGSCNSHQSCQWVFDKNTKTLTCDKASGESQRICATAPKTPYLLPIKERKDEIEVSWIPSSTSADELHVVTLKKKSSKDNLFSSIAHNDHINISKSLLQIGMIYDVSVTRIYKNSMSAQNSTEFSMGLKAPIPSYEWPSNGVISVSWRKIVGAAKYEAKLLDSEGKLIEQVDILPTSFEPKVHFSGVASDIRYTVIIIAISGDGIEASGKVTMYSRETAAVAVASPQCSTVSIILAIFVCLFVILLCIVLLNNWTLRSKVLRSDADDCAYKRYMLIWRKTKHVGGIKFEEDRIASSRA